MDTHARNVGVALGTLLASGATLLCCVLPAVLVSIGAGATLVALVSALPQLVWVRLFHLGDALQTVAASVLRAYQVATLPMVIYVVALWGLGIGGGYALAFGAEGNGAVGFWQAATAGLIAAALLLSLLLRRVFNENR